MTNQIGYDQDRFYAMCDELGRLMDAERALQAAREQASWQTGFLTVEGITVGEFQEALERVKGSFGSMAGGMSRLAMVSGDAGVQIQSFAEAMDPPKFAWMEESVEMTSEQWDALERRVWKRRAYGTPLQVSSTDDWQMRRLTRWEIFLVDVMDASRGKRWLGWLSELALALLKRSK